MSAARFASLPRVSAWLLALTAGLSTGCANYYYGPPGQGELPGHSRQSGPGLGGLLPPPLPADVLQANEQAADALLERSGLDMRSTVLVATHSPVVMAWADRVIHLPGPAAPVEVPA